MGSYKSKARQTGKWGVMRGAVWLGKHLWMCEEMPCRLGRVHTELV